MRGTLLPIHKWVFKLPKPFLFNALDTALSTESSSGVQISLLVTSTHCLDFRSAVLLLFLLKSKCLDSSDYYRITVNEIIRKDFSFDFVTVTLWWGWYKKLVKIYISNTHIHTQIHICSFNKKYFLETCFTSVNSCALYKLVEYCFMRLF